MRTPPLIRSLKTAARVSGMEGFHCIIMRWAATTTKFTCVVHCKLDKALDVSLPVRDATVSMHVRVQCLFALIALMIKSFPGTCMSLHDEMSCTRCSISIHIIKPYACTGRFRVTTIANMARINMYMYIDIIFHKINTDY